MPTYVYKCKKCGKIFEYQQSINDEPLKRCPEEVCENAERGEVFRKISSNVGLVFNGSGFYLTDYKKNHGSTAAKTNGNGHTNGHKNDENKKVKAEKPAS